MMLKQERIREIAENEANEWRNILGNQLNVDALTGDIENCIKQALKENREAIADWLDNMTPRLTIRYAAKQLRSQQ